MACDGRPSHASSPVPTPTPLLTLSADNVRERVVAALLRERLVTEFALTEEGAGDDGALITGWLDLARRRGRAEQRDGFVSVVAEDVRTEMLPSTGVTSLSEYRIGSLSSVVDYDLRPMLDNPALTLLYPLISPLLSPGGWVLSGDGDWQGQPAQVWETDYFFGDEFGNVHTLVYVDSRSELPLGQRLELPGESYGITYRFDFVDPSDVPTEAFDGDALREQLLGYGRYEGAGPDYPLPWLGLETGPLSDFPSLTLRTSRVSSRRDTRFTEFTYHVTNHVPLSPDARFGLLEVTVRPKAAWEAYARERSDRWWESAPRKPVVVLGQEAEFAVQSFNNTDGILWLPDVVVSFEAAALTGTISADRFEGGVAPTPVYDRSAFNNEEALRTLVGHLEVLR